MVRVKMKDSNSFLQVYCSIFLLIVGGATTGSLTQVLPLHAARAAATEGRLQGEVNVLARIQPDDEGRNVHNLLADTRKRDKRS